MRTQQAYNPGSFSSRLSNIRTNRQGASSHAGTPETISVFNNGGGFGKQCPGSNGPTGGVFTPTRHGGAAGMPPTYGQAGTPNQ